MSEEKETELVYKIIAVGMSGLAMGSTVWGLFDESVRSFALWFYLIVSGLFLLPLWIGFKREDLKIRNFVINFLSFHFIIVICLFGLMHPTHSYTVNVILCVMVAIQLLLSLYERIKKLAAGPDESQNEE